VWRQQGPVVERVWKFELSEEQRRRREEKKEKMLQRSPSTLRRGAIDDIDVEWDY
jgi:hypothetical protein